ncbi:MAG: site-specific integrase [Muribaculaceae bacterium]|nr:site-specific integrase [Muribaculaceae bacterium]
MFSYKFYIQTDRDNDLRLRIINNRRKVEISTGNKWTPEQLTDALSDKPVKANVEKRKYIAMCVARLESLKIQLAEDGRADEDVTVIKALVMESLFYKTQQSEDAEDKVLLFMHHYNEFASTRPSKRTQAIYKATVSRMRAFDKDIDKLRFEDITVQWLTRFDTYLTKTSPAKNARNIHFRNIRAVIRDAFKADLTTVHPFDRFSIKPEPTRKRALPIDTLKNIFNAEVEPWQQKYLDFFKLTFMLIGINVIDLCGVEVINDGRIDYVRSKTHKPVSVKVEPEAMELIKKYQGETKLLDFVEGYNNYRHFYNNLCKGLKAVKEKLGIKELTSYWARHSWATIAYSLDIPKETIAHALSQGNYTVTDIYIDYDIKKVDEANRRVLDWVLYGKR